MRMNHKEIERELSWDNLQKIKVDKYTVCPVGTSIGKWSRTYLSYPIYIRVRKIHNIGNRFIDLYYSADYGSGIKEMKEFLKRNLKYINEKFKK